MWRWVVKERLAFDVCPLNLPLNRIAQLLGAEYDAGGQWARSGSVHDHLLGQLNALEYYQQAPPKSLGVEWLNSHFYPLCAQVELDGPDFLRTLTEHMAWQVARIFEGWAGEVLVTGGGAYNAFLIEQIQSKTNLNLVIPDSQTVEFKEALIFALLGVLRYNAIPNALASVTGASRDSVNGAIYLP
jgi:anhydro-N-acetylmuramic acid kinase